jgi:hypothetical protein
MAEGPPGSRGRVPGRIGAHGEAVRQALPDAAQVSDRWHPRAQRDLSPNTVAAYRDTWRLLITHLADTPSASRPAGSTSRFWTSNASPGFLDHLEQARGNSASTRNTHQHDSFDGLDRAAWQIREAGLETLSDQPRLKVTLHRAAVPLGVGVW